MAEATNETAIAVIEHDAVILSQIVRALSEIPNVSPHNDLDEALATRPRVMPQYILVLGPSQVEQSIIERVGEIARSEPGTGALLVVATPDNAILRSALRAGLDDAVPLERVDEDLVGSVRDIDRELRAATAELQREAQRHAEAAPGRVMAVFSPKGGVGRSVIASNLAVSLAERTRRRVVIVDADPQFGDIAMMFRLNPVHSISDAVAAGDYLDSSLLESLLTHDERTGVDVLAAPTDPTSPANLTPKTVSHILNVLRSMSALVVIDAPRALDDVGLQLLSDSDDIVYVVGMDIPSVKNARLGIQAIELVQIPLERVLLVLNRADSRVQLSPRDIEKVLEMKLDLTLPSDALVPKSVNRGVPAVVSDQRSKFAGKIHEIAEQLLSRAASEANA